MMLIAWMLLGVTMIAFIMSVMFVESSGVPCAWCRDTVWDADNTPLRRPYVLYVGETIIRADHLYCSTYCLEAHEREMNLHNG